ncbi:2-dehydro-3-deoxygalactonokinase [Lentilactobacillus hilgardii]|nr:2-dehydro-3-deoxygalactonokinase [Lentilactobacillus hilgardii]
MKTVITIDTGTTNTRVVLWQEGKPVVICKKAVGVRNTAISGSKKQLKDAIRKAIKSVLSEKNIKDTTDIVIIASGMITSNLGLAEIPHLKAPVGLIDLANGMKKVLISEVFEQPIWFIPGVKNNRQSLIPENITDMDVIRGEEVEAIGAINLLNLKGSALIVLPGSHTKIIKINDQGKIAGSITSMTGELLDLLTKHSILANSVGEQFIETIDEKCLILGAKTAEKNGLGRTAFIVRLLDMYSNYTRNQRANYLLGAVLSNDLKALKNTHAFEISQSEPIVILGKPGLRDALKILIQSDPNLTGEVKTEEIRELAGKGAILMAKQRNIFELAGGK